MTKGTPLTAQEISDRLTAREREYLQAVREDSGKGGARDALRFLAQKAGLPEEGMYLFFVETARASADQKAKRKPIPQDSTPEEVLSFARGLSNTSRKIRRLNQEAFWGAAHVLKSDATYQELPNLLYMYARNLQLKAEDLLRRRNIYRKIGTPEHRADKELLETVQRLTGRKHRDKSAAILRVIYPLFGLTPEIKGESLRKREQRERRQA
jgi:hypothetical protein